MKKIIFNFLLLIFCICILPSCTVDEIPYNQQPFEPVGVGKEFIVRDELKIMVIEAQTTNVMYDAYSDNFFEGHDKDGENLYFMNVKIKVENISDKTISFGGELHDYPVYYDNNTDDANPFRLKTYWKNKNTADKRIGDWMPIIEADNDSYYNDVIFSDCSDDSQNIKAGEVRTFMTTFTTYQFFSAGNHKLIIDYNKTNKKGRLEMQMYVNLK